MGGCLYPTIHQTKGWNCTCLYGTLSPSPVFILQSIKPRVETNMPLHPGRCGQGLYPTIHQTKGWNLPGLIISITQPGKSLSYNPSNQGLKQGVEDLTEMTLPGLYPTIHQTKGWNWDNAICWWRLLWVSLSYNPSNQGLKHIISPRLFWWWFCLYPTIHQTKGWNKSPAPPEYISLKSLSYNPSNQGLKLPSNAA